ncbi:MAG: hypothetical protein J6V22_01585 [Clostridia bacterium]|nr:hypothetical protein [Clostridia bacterium]
MTQLIIKNPQDRRDMVSILADNGYTVKIGRIKVGSQNKVTVDILDEEKKDK